MIGREELKNRLKPIISLKCLLLTRILFALYSKCTTSRIIRKLIQLYCVLYAITVIYTVSNELYYNAPSASVRMSLFCILVQAVAGIAVSLYSAEEYIITYSEELKGIDRSIGIASSGTVPASYCLLWTVVVIRALSVYLLTKYDIIIFNYFVMYNFSALSIYASRITSMAIYELLDDHMRSRRRYIQDKFNGSLTNDEMMLHLTTFLDTYKKLINILKPTFKLTAFMMVLGYTFDFLNVILIMGRVATSSDGALDWKLVFSVTQLGLYFLALSGSSVFYQSAASELDAIQQIFADQLLTNRDGRVRERVRDVLEHVKYNPIVVSVWCRFPVDLQLSLGFFNLATAYAICVLQCYY